MFCLLIFEYFDKPFCMVIYRMDATLSEILINLRQKNRKIRRSGTVISFQIVSPDPARPRYRTRDIGSVKVDHKGPDDYKTLSHCRSERKFQ